MKRPGFGNILTLLALLGACLLPACVPSRPSLPEDIATLDTGPSVTPGKSITTAPSRMPDESSAALTYAPQSHTPTPSLTPGSIPTVTPSKSTSTIPTTATPIRARATDQYTPVYGYEVINTFPHDPRAFTQGLIFYDGFLYEGTGLYGGSSLRKVDPQTGKVLQSRILPAKYFGEGITIFNDQLFQLTWKSRIGFIYDLDSFRLLSRFEYPTQGWGITHDGRHLIMSDGSSSLYFIDPTSLERIDQVEVFDENGPVDLLNELEYIEGEVFANVWKTDLIAIIDPNSGRVGAWLDLSGILNRESIQQPIDVLNGITYDPQHDRLFVTGKLWPTLFEIELVPPSSLEAE